MPVSQAKRIAIEAYRLRNLDKHRQWSLNCYYRKRALLPEEERRGPGRPKKAPPTEPITPGIIKRGRGRPKIEKPPKVRNPVGRPKILKPPKPPKKLGRPKKAPQAEAVE